jgi:isoleucyl-tRNA synthetase
MQPENKNTKKSVNEKELETLKYWEENKIFEKSLESPAGGAPRSAYSFYDGPPFATGMPHHGHILAGTIKDVIPRYKTMQGQTVRRVWGWDCHGLPIENLIEKELSLNSKQDIENLGIEKFTDACAASVMRYDSEWKSVIPRLGRWVDMDNAYKTMDSTYTESVWWAWKQLYDKGLAYEGYKIMHICPRCETPLAQSEVGLEYHDITDMTVTAKFELVDESGTFVLAWTTTPWTLPGNTALAVNKNLEYVKVKVAEDENYYIVSKKLSEKVFAGKSILESVDINVNDLLGKKYLPPFNTFNKEDYLNKLENSQNIWKIWHAEFITDESGTGIAHEAPAFGAEDMDLAKANNIPVIKHVLMNGHFVPEVEESVPELAGLVVKKKDDSISTDIEVVKWLAHNGKLFSKEKIVHSYPLCWRCKTPLLNYATSSWFVDVPKIKSNLLEQNATTKWVPEHMRDGRFGKWLEGAREWAVSRRRYWGAPLPIWKSVKTDEIFVAGSLEDLAKKLTPNNEYYVMRHGEAKSNVDMIIDCGMDPNNTLTEKGKAQAEDAFKNIDVDFDMVISSPYLRTIETAKYSGKNIETDDRLREFNMGVFNGKKVDEYTQNLGDVEYLRLNTRAEGGETHREMMNRCMSLIEDLESKYFGKKILFVTHGGPMRMLIASAELITEEGLVEDEIKHNAKLYPRNAELRKVNYKKVPRDATGAINLHRPHIDKIVLKDSEGNDMKLIGDVFDCWFESGSMPFAQLHYPFENVEVFNQNFPADFIAEGVDQTRGWFYSLLNVGVGLFDKTPFKHVIVNGHVLAKGGEKLSKSLKNYTDPMILVEKFGADAMRYALVNSPAMRGEAVEFPDTLPEEAYKKNIQRLENVLDFYNMYKKGEVVAHTDSNNVLDRWIIERLHEVINRSVDGYEAYKLDEAVSGVDVFIDDFSTWYLRRSRERLKDGDVDAMSTMKYVFVEFAKCIAPVMPFLAERLYQDVMGTTDSVHLQSYPVKKEVNQKVLDEMRDVREQVTSLLMIRQKNNMPVRQPLSMATINKNINEKYFEVIMEEVNVKAVQIDEDCDGPELDLSLDEHLIREGRQRELSREIKDRRKELGLVAGDEIVLFIDTDRHDLVDDEYKREMKIREVHVSEDLIVEKAN